MTQIKRIAKNTFYMASSRVVAKIANAVFLMIAARLLGVEDYGIFILVSTYVVMFSFLTDLGIYQMAIREIARDNGFASIYLNTILSLRSVLSILSYFAMGITVYSLNYSLQIRTLIYLFGISLLVNSITGSWAIVYEAYEKMSIPATLNMLSMILFASLGIVILYEKGGLKTLIMLRVAVDIIIMVISGYYFWNNFFKFNFSMDVKLYKQMLVKVLPYTLLEVLFLLDAKIDIIMLSVIKSHLEGSVALAYYSACCSLLGPFIILPEALGKSLVPMISQKLGSNVNSVRISVEKSTKFIIIFISFPILIIFIFFAPQIINLFFGAKYLPAAKSLPIIALAFAIKATNIPISNVLATSDKLFSYVPWAAAMASLNVILNLWLIPKYSFMGAAIATLASIFFITLVKYHFIRKILDLKLYQVKKYMSILLPIVITIAIMYCMHSRYTLLNVICFILSYSASIFLCGAIDRYDLQLIASMVRK